MEYTTTDTTDIIYTVPVTDTNMYSTMLDQLVLYLTVDGVTTRYNASSALDVSGDTEGNITFTAVPTVAEGLYVLKILLESSAALDGTEADLPSGGVTITTLATGTFRKVSAGAITVS